MKHFLVTQRITIPIQNYTAILIRKSQRLPTTNHQSSDYETNFLQNVKHTYLNALTNLVSQQLGVDHRRRPRRQIFQCHDARASVVYGHQHSTRTPARAIQGRMWMNVAVLPDLRERFPCGKSQ